MSVFEILTLFGGLALFLYGMKQMGDGLERASSGTLSKLLEKLTGSKLRGVLLGAGVTAVINSSSATTVTIVGFVNSGVMRLAQAIPIIIGANIGTTFTSWLLALTGIDESNVFLRLLKPSSFSPVMALIGIIMIFAAKSSRKREAGGIMVAFAVLMYGMQLMSGAVAPLADMPGFQQVFTMFENPLLGLMVGALLTAVIQSSAASIGILQALALTGSVTFATAIPIIMGQNIGTCITAILSCFGANKNAKRAAMVHLYFNVIGSLVFMGLYVLVRAVFAPAILSEAIGVSGIAAVHTSFNVLSTMMLLPFTKQLEWLAVKTIRSGDEKERDVLLDDRLLSRPAFAVTRCAEVTVDMAEKARHAVLTALTLLDGYDATKVKSIVEYEDMVDKYEDRLGTFLVKVSASSLSEQESREVSKILHGIGDFERISDHAVNLTEVAQEIYDKKIGFTDAAKSEIAVLRGALEEIIDTAVRCFATNDVKLAKWVEPLEEVIDELIRELKLRHIERLRDGRCTVETGFVFADLLANLERVADHCSNLAICVIELEQGEYNAHQYLLSNEGKGEFDALYNASRRKYALPQMAAAANQ